MTINWFQWFHQLLFSLVFSQGVFWMSRSCLPPPFPPCFCPWERCGQEISERARCVTQTIPFGPVCLDGPRRLRGSRQCRDIPGTAPNQLWLRFLRASASALHSLGLQRGHVRNFCKNYSGIVKLIHNQSMPRLRAHMDVWLPPDGPHWPVLFCLPL